MSEEATARVAPQTLEAMVAQARRRGRVRMIVAGADDAVCLRAAAEAVELGVVSVVLIGDEPRVREAAAEAGVSVDRFRLVQADGRASAAAAVRMVHDGEADLLMKGLLPTKVLMRAVLDREFGLRARGLLSHVAAFEAPAGDRLVLLTDAGVNVNPRFHRKMGIVANAVGVARRLGLRRPKVAVLAAVEKLDLPAMRATVDAEMLRRLGEAGCFGDCVVAGPISLDVALSADCAARKGLAGPVAGAADVLVTPNIETANVLYKAITCIARKELGGVVVGARVPVIVPSRGDTVRTKLYSIAFAALLSGESAGDAP